jgi:hypothetical protein
MPLLISWGLIIGGAVVVVKGIDYVTDGAFIEWLKKKD